MSEQEQTILHPEFRNAVYLVGGQIECETNDPVLGWAPDTVARNDNPDFFDHIVESGNVAAYEPPPPPSHAEQRAAAFARVNQKHAHFLLALTGNATDEERDTWQTKEDAARALVDGSATEGQQAMIDYEAQGAGTEPLVLAQKIIAKAEDFQSLIGMAAGLRAKARTAIKEATNEETPIEEVAPALEHVFSNMAVETKAAIAKWKGQADGG